VKVFLKAAATSGIYTKSRVGSVSSVYETGSGHGPQAGGYWVPACAGTTGGEGLRVGKDIVGSQIGKDAGGAARPRPPRRHRRVHEPRWRARVAVARELTAILHRIWVDGSSSAGASVPRHR